jgi:endonuclease-3
MSMKRSEKAERIMVMLEELYPETPVPLDHSNAFELLVAVLMSAQTTDLKVNEVTPALFKKANNAAKMAQLDVEVIRNDIRQIGLAPTKAKNIKRLSEMLVELHGGKVPNSFEHLEALPGVGHKTASVVMSQAFGVPAFPVDTHMAENIARHASMTSQRVQFAHGLRQKSVKQWSVNTRKSRAYRHFTNRLRRQMKPVQAERLSKMMQYLQPR